MTEKLDLYRCNVCNTIVQIMNAGEGELVCCNQPMEFIVPHKSENEGLEEKHIPIVQEFDEDKCAIRVGSMPHPMESSHYIMFIQNICKEKKDVHTKFFSPNEEAIMHICCKNKNKLNRAYCNLHGLWEDK